MRSTIFLSVATALLCAFGVPNAAAQSSASGAGGQVEPVWPRIPAPENAVTAASWRTLIENDLDYVRELLQANYIYASYPDSAAFQALSDRLYAQALQDAALVSDLGGYRAVLERFVGGFQDAHFSAYFLVQPILARWPGFSVRYQGGRYLVDASVIPEVNAGDELHACDGRSAVNWVDGLTEYYGGARGRETTRATIASRLMVDLGNPLFERPARCRIGDQELDLQWRDVGLGPGRQLPLLSERTTSSVATIQDDTVGVEDFGERGAWVRIGTMMPLGEESVTQFQNLITAAPSLRDREFIIMDVRGNAGGMYNWFMAFVRALYGAEYADYYARA